MPGLAEESFLKFQYKWFIASQHGCSCGFRHLYIDSVDLGFGAPEDWYPEEDEDIEATLRFIQTVKKLLNSRAKVDCIDVWDNQDGSCDLSGLVDVDIFSIKDEEFRFYENHQFVFSAKTQAGIN